MHTKFWLENQKGRDHSEDLGISGRTILKCVTVVMFYSDGEVIKIKIIGKDLILFMDL